MSTVGTSHSSPQSYCWSASTGRSIMGQYIMRRVLIAIPTLLIISFVIFAILALAPGDPLAQFALNPAIPESDAPVDPPAARPRSTLADPLRKVAHRRSSRQLWLLLCHQGPGNGSDLAAPAADRLQVVGTAYVHCRPHRRPDRRHLAAVRQYSFFDQSSDLPVIYRFFGALILDRPAADAHLCRSTWDGSRSSINQPYK